MCLGLVTLFFELTSAPTTTFWSDLFGYTKQVTELLNHPWHIIWLLAENQHPAPAASKQPATFSNQAFAKLQQTQTQMLLPSINCAALIDIKCADWPSVTMRLWRLFAISDDNAGMLLLAEQSSSNNSAYQLSYLPVWRQLKNCAVIVVFNHSGEFSIPATCCRVSHLVPFENLIIVKVLIWTRCRFLSGSVCKH